MSAELDWQPSLLFTPPKAPPRAALLLASGFSVQYRALRAVAAVVPRVIVAGTGSAGLLTWSRYGRRYHALPEGAFQTAASLEQIEAICVEHGIDLIVPADGLTTRYLAIERRRILRACFPTPGPEDFDRLDDKWRFYCLCTALGVPAPETRRFGSRGELEAFLARNPNSMPGMAKPLNLYGGLGILRIGSHADLAEIDYAPILFQAFIPGEDIDISVIARDGLVERYCIYRKAGGRVHYIENAALIGYVEIIVARLGVSGVLNFGARIDAGGEVWMTECNPRFWHSMDFAQIAGMNFFAETLWPGEGPRNPLAGRSVGTLHGIARRALRLRPPGRMDLRMLAHTLRDPLPRLFGYSDFG